MSPLDFKRRYLAGLPKVPPTLKLRLDAFVQFPPYVVEQLTISAEDKAIITTKC